LIVVSIAGFSIETLPGLSSSVKQLLNGIEVATVGIFTVEYILRIAVADLRLRFIISFYGVVDLLAILPFYSIYRPGSEVYPGPSISSRIPGIKTGPLQQGHSTVANGVYAG